MKSDKKIALALEKIRFDERGLVPVIAQDFKTGAVLMLAWMNAQAVEKTIETGNVHYWSRSRNALWRKGETSGHIQALKSFTIDCDDDTILLKVEQTGPACHTGQDTCFFTDI